MFSAGALDFPVFCGKNFSGHQALELKRKKCEEIALSVGGEASDISVISECFWRAQSELAREFLVGETIRISHPEISYVSQPLSIIAVESVKFVDFVDRGILAHLVVEGEEDGLIDIPLKEEFIVRVIK